MLLLSFIVLLNYMSLSLTTSPISFLEGAFHSIELPLMVLALCMHVYMNE